MRVDRGTTLHHLDPRHDFLARPLLKDSGCLHHILLCGWKEGFLNLDRINQKPHHWDRLQWLVPHQHWIKDPSLQVLHKCHFRSAKGPRSLPRPPGQSFYVEVINFENDTNVIPAESSAAFIGANWRFCREQQKAVLGPYSENEETFTSANFEATFCAKDRCMYVTKVKSSFGHVELKFNEVAWGREGEVPSFVSKGTWKFDFHWRGESVVSGWEFGVSTKNTRASDWLEICR